MRSTEEIFDAPTTPSASSAPVESDSPQAADAEPAAAPVSADASDKPAPAPTKAAPAAPAVTADDAEDDPADKVTPKDLAGLERALQASRGDKRTLRKKWQTVNKELESAGKELAALKSEVSRLRQPAPAPAERAAAPAESPEDIANKFWQDPIAFVRSSVPDVDAVATRTRADVSEFYARQSHADYEERKAYFMERAAKDPSLLQAVFAAPAPAEALYQKSIALKEREEFDTNPDAWREAERARLKAEIQSASALAKPPASRPPPPPKSNASARGTGAGGTRTWSGPRSTEQVFDR